MLIIVLFITNSRKARRPGFILNIISLFLYGVNCIVSLSVGWLHQYSYGVAENHIPNVARELYPTTTLFAISMIACVAQGVMYLCILVSLILQVRVVFVDRPRSRYVITVILTALSLGLEACYITFRAFILIHYTFSAEEHLSFDVLEVPLKPIFDLSFVAVVSICCLLFLFKLFVVIKASRGIRGFMTFGPLQLLFLTFLFCLVVPGNNPPLACFSLLPSHLIQSCVDCPSIHAMRLFHFSLRGTPCVHASDSLTMSVQRGR